MIRRLTYLILDYSDHCVKFTSQIMTKRHDSEIVSSAAYTLSPGGAMICLANSNAVYTT